MADRHVFALLHEALRDRVPAVLVTVIEAPDSALVGAKALFVRPQGQTSVCLSTLPDEWMAEVSERAEKRLGLFLGGGSSRRIAVETLNCAPGVSVSVEAFQPRPRLVIAGAGHIAVPAHEIADIVGFAVTVLDDRPSFADPQRFPRAERVVCEEFAKGIAGLGIDSHTAVVVVTRGHLHDLEVLRALATTTPAYVGMIGSRRRTLTVLRRLVEEGYPEEFVDGIYAPIGLDIGAETPQEIALAIVSEVVCVIKGGSGTHLRRGIRRIRLE